MLGDGDNQTKPKRKKKGETDNTDSKDGKEGRLPLPVRTIKREEHLPTLMTVMVTVKSKRAFFTVKKHRRSGVLTGKADH